MLRTTTQKRVLNTRTLVASSLFIAISIILTRFFAVIVPLGGLPALRLGFGQIPLAITGILYGPITGGIAGAVADLVGFTINPHGGSFFPGFTISSMLWGILPGLFYTVLKNKKININFNILNTLFILLIAFGLGNVLTSNGILALENGSVSIQGDAIYTILIFLSVITLIAFIVTPYIITKKYNSQNKGYDIYSIDKIIFIITVSYIIIALGLNTLWLSIMFKKGFIALLPGRILAGVFVIPIFSTTIVILSKFFKYGE